ncbi:endoprotease [Desulfovibrio sp. JC010]|uniref:endoprotease n=1 Tax=Desulfovibrio sp. JC010 TaxID=2593641 RepID=UPI0013D06BB1|nr:endoprotease [Desulfovibrio sp. JC010]NDV28191.1 endoprotease [Desulfovibrio sp. JC010]
MMDFPVGNDSQPDHYSPQAKMKDVAEPVLGGDTLAEEEELEAQPGSEVEEAEQLTDNPVPNVPEAYELDYGLPDGIDPHVDRQFRQFAHENGVSGEMAQKLVDFHNSLETARFQDHQTQTGEWERETRSLPGWHGNNYRKNMGVANKALQAFASPALAKMIRESGYSCHPEVVKTFYNVGRRLTEDSYVDSNRNTGRQKTIGEILYPNQPI